MYQLFGIRACLTAFGVACGIVLVLWAWRMPPSEPAEVWRLISGSVTVVGVLTYLLGQTAAFPWLCRQPIVRSFFPDVDGHWTGTMESNWPTIMERAGLVKPGEAPAMGIVPADFTIKARLFYVKMNQASTSGYTTSKTIFVRLSRDAEDGEVRLNYMYEATTLRPVETDSGKHHGAGYVDLKGVATDQPRLEGVYWTNRNWHNALNTAGKILLTRA